MNKKNAIATIDYLNAKLSNLTSGLNYWQSESDNLDNTELRQKECSKNIADLQSAFNEIYSMVLELKMDFNIK
jgi:hypothetical protein